MLNSGIRRSLWRNLFSQMIIVYSLAVSPVVYFLMTCIQFAQNNKGLFVILVAATVPLTLGILSFCLKTGSGAVCSYIVAGGSGSDELGKKALRSVFRYPYLFGVGWIASWMIVGNTIFGTFFLLGKASSFELVLCQPFLLGSSLISFAVSTILTESQSSSILKQDAFSSIDVKSIVYGRSLFFKLILFSSLIVIAPIFNIISALVVTTTLGITIKDVGVGFALLSVQGVGLALLVGFCLARSIRSSLVEVNEFLQVMAESKGDLTRHISLSTSQELGRLGTLFNEFISFLRSIISEISTSSSQLQSSTSELSGVAGSISGSAADVSLKNSATTISVEQITVSLNGISSATEEMLSQRLNEMVKQFRLE